MKRLAFAHLLAFALPGLLPGPAAGAADPAGPDAIYALVAPGVVTIRVFDETDHELGQGSAVVVAPRLLATNCHVIRDGARIEADSGAAPLPAQRHGEDESIDLCLLQVDGLATRPAPRRKLSELAVGEPVVAVGNPLGFGLAASSGIVVATPGQSGQSRFITSAPVSPGSSGGGLFDLSGRLVGITAASLGTGQRLSLAIGTDRIDALLDRPSSSRPTITIPEAEPDRPQEALRLAAAKDWHGLEELSRRWISEQADSALAHFNLAMALTETNRSDEAEEAVDEALARDPYHVLALGQKAILRHARGDLAGAETLIQRARNGYPANAGAHRLRAEWLLHAKRYDEARSEALESPRLDPLNQNGWGLLGRVEDALGNRAAATRAFAIALELGATEDALRLRLAELQAQQGAGDSARATIANAPPSSQAPTWEHIAASELAGGRLRAAEDAARKAVALRPDHATGWALLGEVLNHSKRDEEAERAFDKAIALERENTSHIANRGLVRLALGRIDAAISDGRRATALSPQQQAGWRVLAIASMRQNDFAGAVSNYRKLESLGPANVSDLTSLGEALIATGGTDEGIATLKRAERMDAANTPLLLSLAKAVGNRGDIEGALAYLLRAEAIEPSNAVVRSSKGYALMRLGRLDESAQALETAVRLDPDSINAWVNLGQTQMNRRQYGRAIEALEKALSLNPDAMDARLYLAQSCLATRQPAKAREHSGLVLKRSPNHPGALALQTMGWLMQGDAQSAAVPYARLRATNPAAARSIREQALRAGVSGAAALPQ